MLIIHGVLYVSIIYAKKKKRETWKKTHQTPDWPNSYWSNALSGGKLSIIVVFWSRTSGGTCRILWFIFLLICLLNKNLTMRLLLQPYYLCSVTHCFSCCRHKVVIVEGNYLLLDEDVWREISSIFDEKW